MLLILFTGLIVQAQDGPAQKAPVDIFLEELTLYPNPTERFLNLSSDVQIDQKVKVGIFNLMGNLELTKEFDAKFDPELKLDLVDLRKGLYFVNIEAGDKKITRRIYII